MLRLAIDASSNVAAFADKRSMFIRALYHYDQKHRADYLNSLRAAHTPRAAIITAFRDAMAAGDVGDRRGCLLVNTSLELSPHDPEIDRIIRTSFAEVEAFFRSNIEDGQAAGEIDPAIDPHETARALLGLFLGLRVLARSSPQPAVMAAIVGEAEAMLEKR